MIKAVIFDMDGVIIDSEPIHLQQNQELFHKWQLNLEKDINLTLIGTNSNFKWKKLKKLYNLPMTVADLIKLDRGNYLKHLKDNSQNLKPITGSLKLIKNLSQANYKLALASSAPIEVIDIIIDTFKIRDCFDVIVSGDFVARSKPEPDIFLLAANKLRVNVGSCLVIEDSKNGILAANKAKMKTIGYQGSNIYHQDLSQADLIINSFKDFNIQLIRDLKS